MKNGFSTAHSLLDDLTHKLTADVAIPPARLKAKRYWNSGLVIINEVGFPLLDSLEANLFFRLVSALYEKGSIILTSVKHVRDWPETLTGDEVLTTAILENLLHQVHILQIAGRIYRLRELDGLLQPQPTVSSHPSKKGAERREAAPVGAKESVSPHCVDLVSLYINLLGGYLPPRTFPPPGVLSLPSVLVCSLSVEKGEGRQ